MFDEHTPKGTTCFVYPKTKDKLLDNAFWCVIGGWSKHNVLKEEKRTLDMVYALWNNIDNDDDIDDYPDVLKVWASLNLALEVRLHLL